MKINCLKCHKSYERELFASVQEIKDVFCVECMDNSTTEEIQEIMDNESIKRIFRVVHCSLIERDVMEPLLISEEEQCRMEEDYLKMFHDKID